MLRGEVLARGQGDRYHDLCCGVAGFGAPGITTRMTESRIFAWILLSVPERPGTLQDIIAMADGINHAIPTHRELQVSLGWLRARGLVRKEGRRFGTTEAGLQLLAVQSITAAVPSASAGQRVITVV